MYLCPRDVTLSLFATPIRKLMLRKKISFYPRSNFRTFDFDPWKYYTYL